MEDVLDGGAGDDGEGRGPEVVSEVGDADDGLLEAGQAVADYPCEAEGEYEDEAYAAQDEQEGSAESEGGGGLYEGEEGGYEQGGDEAGEEGVGGDGVKGASELYGDDGCRGCGGADDAGEYAFPEGLLGGGEGDKEQDGDDGEHEDELGKDGPEVPPLGPEAAEIYSAEGDEEDEEHEPGQGLVDGGAEEPCGWVEGGGEVEQKVDGGAEEHG